MTWIIFSLAATLLWSICNLIDKAILERYVPERTTAIAFGIYPVIVSAFVFTVALFLNPHALDIRVSSALILMAAGGLELIALICYFRALQHEDTSTVVPFLQAIPVFSFVLGFLFLGETLTLIQFATGVCIILGGVVLSIETAHGASRRFRVPLIMLMLTSAFCYALFDTFFKLGALQEDFWTGVVWQHLGLVFTGVVIFSVSRVHRERAFNLLHKGGVSIFLLNVVNEIIYAGGMMLGNFALLLAPIALVGLVNVYHPAFVFVLGLVLALVAPRILNEEVTRKGLIFKMFALLLILVASVILALNS